MTLRIAVAQIDPVVGDVAGNARRVLECAARARDELGADLAMFPELVICGYPPEDLLFHGNMRKSVAAAIETLCRKLRGIAVLVGYPEYEGRRIYNSAVLIRDGRVVTNYRKQMLPNYGVFDEKRYFTPGENARIVDLAPDGKVESQQPSSLSLSHHQVPGPPRQSGANGDTSTSRQNSDHRPDTTFERRSRRQRKEFTAAGSNGLGVAGISWQARVMVLRTLGGSGTGDTAAAVLAFEYASAMGTDVINCSWGGAGYSQALKDVIDASPALVVCAAGNSGAASSS